MRMLFLSSPAIGHLMPILPVALAAASGGHEVRVACGASLAAVVGRTGLRHVEMGPPSVPAASAGIAGLAETVGPERAVVMYRESFGGVIAAAIADRVVALAGDWRPDILVHEDLEMGSWIAGEQLGIPHVTIQATAWRPHQLAELIAPQNAIRSAHGLDPDPELAGLDGRLWFTTRPPALRPSTSRLPGHLRELRPQPDDRVGGDLTTPPAWLAAASARPRVAVTLGTMNAHRIDLLRPIVDGLATLDVDVVVALGAEPASLGDVAPNVRVERYVAMSDLLPRSAVVVHHAGAGTTLAALAAGVPSAMIPIAADQPENAAATIGAGAALILGPGTPTGAEVAATVRRLLETASFRERARSVAAEIAAMPGPVEAVVAIEAVA